MDALLGIRDATERKDADDRVDLALVDPRLLQDLVLLLRSAIADHILPLFEAGRSDVLSQLRVHAGVRLDEDQLADLRGRKIVQVRAGPGADVEHDAMRLAQDWDLVRAIKPACRPSASLRTPDKQKAYQSKTGAMTGKADPKNVSLVRRRLFKTLKSRMRALTKGGIPTTTMTRMRMKGKSRWRTF